MLWVAYNENVFNSEQAVQQMAFRGPVKLDEGNIG